jgi:glycosyltransferase involved in cell wall biosynthesis
MRILAVTNMYPSAATVDLGTFVQEQVESLRGLGHTVEVLVVDRRGGGVLSYREVREGVRARVESFRPDVVHAMYGGLLAALCEAAARPARFVVSFCGSDLLGEPLAPALRRLRLRLGVAASRRAARRADAVIVKSEALAQALPASVVARAGFRVIPNGVDLSLFRPIDSEPCRQALGWAPGTRHVLFPADPARQLKRFPLARGAVDRVRALGLPVELHALGGVSHRDMPTWLNASDCVILTSTHEGSPNVVKEALACNRPIVSVDVGDVRQRIEGVRHCFVTAATEADLADGLRRALTDEAAGGAEEGRRRVEDLSLTRIAERIARAYAREGEEDWRAASAAQRAADPGPSRRAAR